MDTQALLATLTEQALVEALACLRRRPELLATLRSLLVDSGPAEPIPTYVTVGAFAQRVGVAKRTVENWITQGLPVVRGGRVRRIPIVEADAWLKTGGATNGLERRARRDARRVATLKTRTRPEAGR